MHEGCSYIYLMRLYSMDGDNLYKYVDSSVL